MAKDYIRSFWLRLIKNCFNENNSGALALLIRCIRRRRWLARNGW